MKMILKHPLEIKRDLVQKRTRKNKQKYFLNTIKASAAVNMGYKVRFVCFRFNKLNWVAILIKSLWFLAKTRVCFENYLDLVNLTYFASQNQPSRLNPESELAELQKETETKTCTKKTNNKSNGVTPGKEKTK